MGKNLSKLTWDDVYFDGFIDIRNEVFCEEDQTIHKRSMDDGWDTYRQCGKKYEDDCEYELRLMRGEIKRIR